jgi:ribosomal protein S18 acetylase RimI-like enzyme
MSKNNHSILRTNRFDIHRQEIKRDEKLGGMSRTLFHAWHHSEDIAKPVCIVTVNESFSNYVEWIHVDEGFRRQGIATEVLRAIEIDIGVLMLDGATEAGEAFVDAYENKFPSPVE